jgi:serine/threonine protein kinase
MSPELIIPEKFELAKSRLTKSSDCYALGMVIYETISGNMPFYEYTETVVSIKLILGEHPSRGAVFPDDLWKMMELCWTSQPDGRPSIADVLQCLRAASGSPEPSPQSGGETGTLEDDRGPSDSCPVKETGGPGVDIYDGARNPNIMISPVGSSETGTYPVGATSSHASPIPHITYCTESILGCPCRSGSDLGRRTLPFPSLLMDYDEIDR